MSSFSTEEISSQLEKVFSSQEFKLSKRLKQFLRYVTDQKLKDEQCQLNQYTIAIEALGCADDFDPTSNAVVRLVARRLRRALSIYYTTQGAGDPIRIDVPKGAYVPVFIENTQVSELNGQEETTSGDTFIPYPESEAGGKPSIAVVRFSCLDNNSDIEYISSGITEEIIISLARFSNFRVVGPLYTEILDSQNLGVREIGEKFKVRFLLEGTIRVREEKLRLTVNLKDTQNDVHIWGEVINCDLQDGSLIDCERHIVNSISSVLADNFGVINTVLFDDIVRKNHYTNESYKGVLLFHHYIQMLDQQSYIDALTQLEANAAKKQSDPLCLALLGDLLITSYFLGYEEVTVLDRIESLARKAVALDPRCQHAQLLMAMIYFAGLQKEKFLEAAKKALLLNPNNAGFSAALAMHLWMAGERKQGMELMASAMDLNPQHPGWYHILPLLHSYKHFDYETALSKALDFNSQGVYLDPLFRAAVYGKLGAHEKATKAAKELLDIFPDFKSTGKKILKRFFLLDEDVEMLWEGLMAVITLEVN